MHAGLPNFVSKLQEAALRVSDLMGPEPAILSRLRQQLASKETNDAVVGPEGAGSGPLSAPQSPSVDCVGGSQQSVDLISHAREDADAHPAGTPPSSVPPGAATSSHVPSLPSSPVYA